jgi:hypothetical protein
VERVDFEIGPCAPAVRYGLLTRVRATADVREVRLLGFALTEQASFLLEGSPAAIASAVTAAKVGTVRAGSGPRRLGPTERRPVGDAIAELVALHRTPVAHGESPLASPWSSHRDLLGFRVAPFFDRRVWAGRIDARLVHVLAGGGDLPRGWPPEPDAAADPAVCLRVAGAVLGVLPADRVCFRLFAHLARASGVRQLDAAEALALTPRRLRQLTSQPEPLLPVARTVLGDHRLRVVP